MLTPAGLQAIRDRLARAPKGPYLVRPLSMGGYHLAAGGRVLGTVRDETARELFEHATVDLQLLLDEIDRLNGELEAARDRLDESESFAAEMREVWR